MKFGAHSYIFTDSWTDESIGILETVKGLGLDCLDIAVGDDVRFAPERVRKRAAELELDIALSPGGAWPEECDLSSDEPSERKAGLAWHKKQIDLARALDGVAYNGSIYGHTGVVRYRRPPSDELERVAEGLRLLAEYGRKRNIAVVLEPMSRFRTHCVNRPEQVMRLIDLADHANLYVLLDTYHMVTEVRDYAAAIRMVADRLWGIHACENDRGIPGGGLVPWDDVFTTLQDTGFSGYVIMEAYNSSIADFAFERGMFHDGCPDPHEFIRKGLEFLKKGLSNAED